MDQGEELLDKKDDPKKFINLLNRNLISMMRSFLSNDEIGSESFSLAVRPLFDLSKILKDISTKKMAIALTYRTSDQIKKLGFDKEAEQMVKIAQQAEQPVAAEPQPQPEQAQVAEEPTPENQNAQPLGNQTNIKLPTSNEVQPARFEDIKTKGPSEGEYDGIIPGEVSITDAASKLEEVASMLADRRIIRFLAEFDIILDKLGIASMFPELAESQSKLIDAFFHMP